MGRDRVRDLRRTRGASHHDSDAWDAGARPQARQQESRLTRVLLSREINNLIRPKRRIIDEVGYLSLEAHHASLLFQAICERYERKQPIVLTRNKAFADWGQVFAGDAVMASAALDRLLHRSTMINVRGDRYRLREKRKARASQEEVLQAQPAVWN